MNSCKRALYAILKGKRVNADVLHTALVEEKGILNSRPIRPNLNAPFDPVEDKEINSRKKYRQAQVLANMFWRRWLKEHLPSLTQRSKWIEETGNMREVDFVLIVEPNIARGLWQVGRIQRIFPGKDDRVRTAEVKTKHGT